VPVVVRSMGDQDALQLGLIENLQRADLTAIDEAQGYRRLSDEFSQTQEDIAKTVGKSRPHVANTLRLLELPGAVHEMIRRGELSAGQARALVGVPDPLVVAQRAVDEKLSARDLERIGAELKPRVKGGRPKATPSKSADTRALEKRIEEALGLKADLKLRGLGEQTLLTLEIRDFDQLDDVVERLTRR
jgi:ParB family chromosome partitioning protein